MAVSRLTVVLFCLGTLCVLFTFFISGAEASVKESGFSKIHAVRHSGQRCKGGLDPKGNQCQDSDDDDVDEAKVSVSPGAGDVNSPENLDDDGSDDAPEFGADQFDVLGH